jgi:16S rRNA (uracil1498-N3)-methyltransferase
VTANQFFVPVIAPGAARIVVRGEEHRHLARSARVRPGESVWLIDAAGRRARARVESVGEDATELALVERQEPEDTRTRVALAQALVEAKKLETILEKVAELGCAAFIPVVSARSVRAAKDRADRKLERWNRIVREAAKQCKGRLVTAVEPPRTLKSLLREPPAGLRLFLSEHGGRPLREIVAGPGAPADGPPEAVVLLVGPKGGWTGAEERDIRAAGFTAVSLGRRILRAETAAVAAAAMIVHFWNEI